MIDLDIVEIENAFRGWLVANPARLSLGKRARTAKQNVRELVGNAIFAGRRPENAHKYRVQSSYVELAITLEQPNVLREYVLDGESDWAESIVNVNVFARGSRPSVWGKRLAECIRICTTSYQGFWTYRSDAGEEVKVEIDAATISGEGEQSPIAGVKTADRWQYRYQTRWRITHAQQPFVPEPIDPPPPPPLAEGIGADIIGETIVR